MRQFLDYDWPGNIRELVNIIERAVILSPGPILNVDRGILFPGQPAPREETPAGDTLADAERRHILAVLEKTNWVIEGSKGAARLLDLQPSTLRSRIERLGLSRD